MKLVIKEKKQKLKGGVGDKHSLEEFDPEEVKLGIKAELEHTDDKEIAKEIVTDHLTEDPNYYSKLKKVGLEEYKSGFGSSTKGNSKHAQGIPTGKNFPFTQKSGRLWKIRAAAKNGPVVAVGAASITETEET